MRIRGIFINIFILLTIIVEAWLLSAGAVALEKSDQPPISPAWVFDHWVWEDDVNTEEAVWELVNGYESRGIPVGAVVIDSPWATEYNNFIFNKEQYPDPEGMIKRLHERGIKVILWMTSMLNVESGGAKYEPKTHAIYDEAKEKGYLCNGGKPHPWWKGKGGFIDYTNPEAVEWWHRQMDRVLDMGIDGWKADGTASLFPANGFCASGPMGPKKYKDLYYMDNYEYTISKNPQAVSWARPVDLLFVNPKGFAPISHSPVNWVGDEHHSWEAEGFIEALQDIFDSARLGYTVVGSDIAGYNGDDEITKKLLIRWAQFGALNPLMENGGHGKHQPWLHDEETVEIYREFVELHMALKPYFYSMMIKGHEKTGPIIHPVKGQWQYRLGDNLFVAAMYTPEDEREIIFPKGRWIDYWNNENVYDEGEIITYKCALDQYPLFVREGSIIPLYLSDCGTEKAEDITCEGKVILDLYPGADAKFILAEEGLDRTKILMKMQGGKDFSLSLAGGEREMILRVKGPSPSDVSVDGEWRYDEEEERLYIIPATVGDYSVTVKY